MSDIISIHFAALGHFLCASRLPNDLLQSGQRTLVDIHVLDTFTEVGDGVVSAGGVAVLVLEVNVGFF